MIQFIKRGLIVSLCLLIYPTLMLRAEWNSFIINFDKTLFGRGAQTWQIDPYNNTWTFFANSNGLLQYDGSAWNIYQLNNRTNVRSVLASPSLKRVYVGGINEFGYFEPSPSGNMIYHCMSDSLTESERQFGNLWGVHEIDNILHFQGDGCVVKYINGKYSQIPSDSKIDCSNVINGTLYLGTSQGVMVLVGNTLFPLQGAESLSQMRIRGVVPYRDGMIIVTAYNGLYYWDKQKMVPFETGLEEFMRSNEVFCIATHGDKIALGTIHKGIAMIDTQSKQARYFNENNGLRNNTVLSLSFDESGNLWAGLDSGINYICVNSPFTNLYSYPHSYGTGYAAAIGNDKLYLGTNRGLYYTSYPTIAAENQAHIVPVPNSSGQVWDLKQIGDDLLCLHDRGIFAIENTTLKRIADITGVWTCQEVLNEPNKIYVGVYDGIYLLEKNNDGWQTIGKIKGIDESCRIFEQESPGVIWVARENKAIRFMLNNDLTAVSKSKFYESSNGLPDNDNVGIIKLKERICFITPQGIFEYDKMNDKVIPANDINKLLNGGNDYSYVSQYNNKLIGLSQHEICIADLDTYKKGGETNVYPINQSLFELVPTFESIIAINESNIIVPNGDGFALFATPEHKKTAQHAAFIQNIYLTYPKDSLIYTANFLDYKPSPRIEHSNNAIRFECGQVLYGIFDERRFQYRLNKGDWSDYTFANTKEYSNLAEGDYLFEVKIVHPDGTISQDDITFSILAPWYRTIWTYLAYTIIFALFLLMLYRWEKQRMKRKKRQIEEMKDKEIADMGKVYEAEKERQDRQIMELEKEKLQYELQHKSQEMANLMINFVRKNEILTEIKQEIQKVSSAIKIESATECKRQLMIINSKIDSNIQSDEVLKRIEDEFDLIHNNFMKRLNAQHPDLSLNERMMCAYLIMNLSTKEIAPLLNISVRGVETIRYRLRKKFDLSREDSLTEYLTHGF